MEKKSDTSRVKFFLPSLATRLAPAGSATGGLRTFEGQIINHSFSTVLVLRLICNLCKSLLFVNNHFYPKTIHQNYSQNFSRRILRTTLLLRRMSHGYFRPITVGWTSCSRTGSRASHRICSIWRLASSKNAKGNDLDTHRQSDLPPK